MTNPRKWTISEIDGSNPREVTLAQFKAENSVKCAIARAKHADNCWQVMLDKCGVDRWSPDAKGKPNTVLRNLYEMKVLADQMMHEAFEVSRKVAA